MEYFWLVILVVALSVQNIFKKQFDVKNGGGLRFSYLFNLIMALAALLFFMSVNLFRFECDGVTLVYSAGFAVGYAFAVIFGLLAIMNGSLALTSLFTSYSLIVPSLWGIIFLGEPTSVTLYIGIALLLVSIFLVGFRRKSGGPSAPITPKWCLYMALSFIGNGECSIVQKMHQIAYPGKYGNEFMIFAMVLVSAACLILVLTSKKKGAPKLSLSGNKYILWAIPCGVANGVVNFLSILLAPIMPASVLFPTLSAGSIVATFIVAVTLYKERQSKQQIIGFAVGVASVILLNL